MAMEEGRMLVDLGAAARQLARRALEQGLLPLPAPAGLNASGKRPASSAADYGHNSKRSKVEAPPQVLHISSCSLRDALTCLRSSAQRRNALEAVALALGHIDSSLEQFVAFCETSPHAVLQNLPATHKASILTGSFTKLSAAFEQADAQSLRALTKKLGRTTGTLSTAHVAASKAAAAAAAAAAAQAGLI